MYMLPGCYNFNECIGLFKEFFKEKFENWKFGLYKFNWNF